MREVGVDELFRISDSPFVRHQVDPAATRLAWATGGAVVVSGTRGRPGETPLGPVFTCLGPVGDLGPLMRSVATVTKPPWRLTVDSDALDVVPDAWRHERHHRWHWMLTSGPTAPATYAACPCSPPSPAGAWVER